MKKEQKTISKLLMQTSGISLVLFLMLHLSVNSLIVIDELCALQGELYNRAIFFMRNNIWASTIENILALGFILHVIVASKQAIKKLKQREKRNSTDMLVLGTLILCFLVMHLIQFSVKPDFPQVYIDGVAMKDTYTMVSSLFANNPIYNLIYIATGIVLGVHIKRGMGNAFPENRWMVQGASILALLFSIGFAATPMYFLLNVFF